MRDALADRLVSGERPALKVQPTQSTSAAKLSNTMRAWTTSVPDVVEDAVIRFFGDAGLAKESSPDTKVTSVIQIVVERPLAKGL